MDTLHRRRPFATALLLLAGVGLAPSGAQAQGQGGQSGPLQRAAALDRDGATAEAKALYQSVIDTASEPAAKAVALRGMAMSYAFDGDCANTIRYEEMVISYWKTREGAEPQNAFYQQGEMANEAARVCIDFGDLDAAERMYRRGSELGNLEPEPRTHPKSLWDYRLAHALARLAARRGNADEARRQVAAARAALDGDAAMAAQQERFFPYLLGYVALYTNDLAAAEAELTRTLAMQGNQNDPFMNTLLALTWEKQGRADEARAQFQKAFDLARGHNPPAAFTRNFVRKKLAM